MAVVAKTKILIQPRAVVVKTLKAIVRMPMPFEKTNTAAAAAKTSLTNGKLNNILTPSIND